MSTQIQIPGDFTATTRIITISTLAVDIGVISSGVAWLLLRLIGIFTNAFYYGRWGTHLVSPAGNPLGYWAVLVPVAGALITGIMARYGTERIRRPRHPRGDRSDPHQRQPRGTAARHSEARFFRDFDRLRRPLTNASNERNASSAALRTRLTSSAWRWWDGRTAQSWIRKRRRS